MQHQNRLPIETVEFLSLEVFITWLDKIMADLLSCWLQDLPPAGGWMR